jgi:hypothetical protein
VSVTFPLISNDCACKDGENKTARMKKAKVLRKIIFIGMILGKITLKIEKYI